MFPDIYFDCNFNIIVQIIALYFKGELPALWYIVINLCFTIRSLLKRDLATHGPGLLRNTHVKIHFINNNIGKPGFWLQPILNWHDFSRAVFVVILATGHSLMRVIIQAFDQNRLWFHLTSRVLRLLTSIIGHVVCCSFVCNDISWGQHGAHLGPVGPRWAPCWPHELCYQRYPHRMMAKQPRRLLSR